MRLILLVLVGYMIAAVACSPQGSLECSASDAVASVSGSVVRVEPQFEHFRGGMGTGLVIESGLVITNAHVLSAFNPYGEPGPPGQLGVVHVTFDDGITYVGESFAADTDADLALISIDTSDAGVADWGEPDALLVGDQLLATGYALDLPGDPTTTSGVFSSFRESGSATLVQTDTPLNPGNSGGPLYDICGKVVGIVTAGTGTGVGLAISADTAREVVQELR